MKIDIITLFPDMFKGPFSESMVKKAQEKDLVTIKVHNLRKWTEDKHKTVDQRPYGGGKGMILMVKPIYKALKQLSLQNIDNLKTQNKKEQIILLTPQAKVFNQKKAKSLSKLNHLILICGHYEGFDERIKNFVNQTLSIGDFVLTGGELAGMVIVDAVTRLIPGVLEKEAVKKESFQTKKQNSKKIKTLDYPQYTRPENFKGLKVPNILLSGNHKKIKDWRNKKALENTKKIRPDLLKN
jgi:tRNA (guanine37-N1)-methyltransferase